MTRIFLIRHAEAEGNCYRRAHGQYDSLLTPNGRAQLGKLQNRFSMIPLDAVYASDLYRARQTAQAVAVWGGHPVQSDPALREISLGDWEDKPWGQIRLEEPKLLTMFTEGKEMRLPGGESTGEALARMHAAVTRIAERHMGDTIAVVSHGYALKLLLQQIAGRSIAHLDNASVSQVNHLCGSFRVVDIGQNDYLRELSTLARQSWWRESGSHEVEFRFEPATLPLNLSQICKLGKTAWDSVYGTNEGFSCSHFMSSCEKSARSDSRYLQFVIEKNKVVGMLQLQNDSSFARSNIHIGLLYLEPPMRGRGLGAQILGEIVSIGRMLGRETITLRVWYKNARALAFYRKMGFLEFGREEGMFGPLLLMRLPITVPSYIR